MCAIKEGRESYNMVKAISEYELRDFQMRNRDVSASAISHYAAKHYQVSQLEFFESGPFTDRNTKEVTFQGKLSLPIHRWYRLTPSFSPHLANDIADHFGLNADDVVLGPFSGV